MQANPFIPRRLDDQWKVGLWDIDVAAPFALCLFLGFLANAGTKGMVAGAVLGILIARWFSKKKADKHPAFAWHWAYWHLPDLLSRMKATPPSHIRRMVG
jgi:conjugal transfer pilus assembly protein TraL